MKRFIFLCILCLSAISCKTADRLDVLDKTLELTPQYEATFRRCVDSLKVQYSLAGCDSVRFRRAWDLHEKYKVYNIDTCLIYANLMNEHAHTTKERVIAGSAMVYALASIGQVNLAEITMNSIPADFVYEPELNIYYESAHHLYFTVPRYDKSKRTDCQRLRHDIRTAMLEHDTTSYVARTYLIHEMNYVRDYKGAERVALSILEMENLPLRYRAINEFNLALIYKNQGDEEKYREHLIEAAIIDLSTATKEYNSLYNLAKVLHRGGDNERAYRYMLQTLNDAIFCNYKDHYQRSASASQTIYQIYEQESSLKRRRQNQLFICLFVLLLTMLLLLVSQHVYSGKVKKANEMLRIANLRLKDGNAIRDHILSKYMEKTVHYIEKVDENNSTMRKTYRKEGLESLLKLLRSPAFADTEFKNYFQDFDQSIVDLFPNFIEEVNLLLQPEHRLSIRKGTTLCTELRILALIRLGITDSPKIARALNISVRTAYCYRNRLRYRAVCPPNEFEKRICEIGLYK